ncbi:complement C3 [Labeo rohita]|uniref:complement C3 n=1 Tax=Labeo rohita TaxID=84645 RepID=UPI0021E2A769|nr:complement C3 [Labeo rohita]
MDVKLLFLSVVLLSSPLLTLCDPLFVLSAPNLLRVGSSENVFLEAQDYSGKDLNVKIFVKDFPNKHVEIMESKSVTLSADHNFQILTDIKIPSDRQYFSNDPLEKQYVYLQAQFPTVILEKVVMLSFQSGYIFVQTDKSIYTPASKVQYRIFSLTPNMTPRSGFGIMVEIMNPQNITVKSDKLFPVKGMISGHYFIPDVASTGIWKVVTLFSDTPQKKFTADFEVKEYVLPTFEVKLTLSKPFFYVRDEKLTVNIEAKYLFGQEVDGDAFVVFGLMDGERKTSIPNSLKKVQIVDGEGTAELTSQTFSNINQLVGRSIYVSVSVLTESGGEMVEAERRGIQIVTSPYTIHFKRTPQFFKPGMPISVSVYVTNPDQTPAENVKVEVSPEAGSQKTKANGIAKFTINTQKGVSTLEITAKITDTELKEQQAERKMTAQAYKSKTGSNNYMNIIVESAELKIGAQMTAYLNTGESPHLQYITYMILSKGQIIKADRIRGSGQSLVSLSLPVTKDMVPSFRIVAYYLVGSSEVVSDSVWVDVEDTCMGKLQIKVKNKMNSYGTEDEVKLQITGDPGAKVGLVVVDKALNVLNKNRLTQTKIWDVIEKHDIGCTAGGGRDSMGVFTDAGLMFESSTAGGTNTRTTLECPFLSKKRRRSLDDEDNYYTDSEDIVSRTQFPESWLWEDIELCENWLSAAAKLPKMLTAYVAKIFAMASDLINVDDNVICSTLRWLNLNKQLPNGSFKEDKAVIHMVGDVQGKDADASLTAFVLIAMQEGREICAGSVGSLNESMRKAVSFLEGRLPQLTNPYAVAMTSYAMANADKLDIDILMRHSIHGQAGRSWTVPGQQYHSLEATAYAVLALVKAKDFDKAGEAVHWLKRQQTHYGASGSTQATIMVFQAVAEYHTQVKEQQNINLEIELSMTGRSRPFRWTFKRNNMHLTRSQRVDINEEFNVTARGTGTATLSVLMLYYARPVEKSSDCTFFGLTVKMEKTPENKLCTKFFHPEREDGALYRLCKGDLCQCAEVYKVKVVGMDLKKESDIYDLKVEEVLKQGTDKDVEGKVRKFLARPSCRNYLGLVKDKSYLIMGKSVDLPLLGGKYILGEHTWVEYWPTQEESQTPEHRERYMGISKLQDAKREKPLVLRADIPDDWLPDTPASTYITITGEVITQTVEQAINGSFMGRLIVQPSGCGEQNMVAMTLPVIATHYLDNTNQWEAVSMDRRTEATNKISTGYQGQLKYRKDDGSYGIWKETPSSTWLTAYVAKVFAMASKLITIDEHVICSALKWLVLHKQLPDGSFKEDHPVRDSEMVGGVRGQDADASLTAFVLIAMQEGREICAGSVGSLHESIRKAVVFLEGRLPKLSNPYAVALTSYALANADKFNKDILMRHSTKGQAGRSWTVSGERYHSIEATAYAVLALVKAKDFDEAGEAVHWLGRQQSHYGGYDTTQTTIIAFQAVAEYRTQVKDKENFNLEVELSVAGRRSPVKWTFRRDNVHLTRSDRMAINKEFTVTARGTGTATLSVLTLYYTRPVEKKSDCTFFDLTVKMVNDPEAKQGAIASYNFMMDFFYKNDKTDATMTIMDIGLPTGFDIEENDLKELSTGKERYIQKYEKNKVLSERGSLILYLNKVSHKETERIAFRMHQMLDVGLLQPAAVTIYEYYSPEKRCTKFYHPDREDGALYRLCKGDLCQCAEENCTYQKKNNPEEEERLNKACEGGMDYVYNATVVGMDLKQESDIYDIRVDKVLKEGTDDDVEGNVRKFLARPGCREHLGLVKGKSYLIMGKSVDLPKLGGSLQYIFGEHTWVEYWPTREESQTPEHRDRYISISVLQNRLTQHRCAT